MCVEKKESMDHLLVHCRRISLVWHLSLSLRGVSWINNNNNNSQMVSWIQPSNLKHVLVGLEEKDDE